MLQAFIFESVGFGEWFVLLAVVLVVVGPKRLPSAARTFGQYYSKFRRAAEGFKRQILDMDTEIGQAVREVQDAVDSAERSMDEAVRDVEDAVRETAPSAADAQSPVPAQSGDPGAAEAPQQYPEGEV